MRRAHTTLIAVLSTIAGLVGVVAQGQVQTPARDTTRPPVIGTAVLTGTIVTDEPNGRPVRRATVNLNSASDFMRTRLTVTDDAGRFTFTRLSAGNVSIYVTKPGYVMTYYGAKRPGRGPGTPVAIGDGQRVSVTMKMIRGAVITGMVSDQAGRPAPQITVQALQYQTINGERILQPTFATSSLGTPTDDRGMYRIYGLPPGDYVVAAAAPRSTGAGEIRQTTAAEIQWAQQQFQAVPGQAGQPPAPGQSIGYAPVFYPGTTDQRSATTITLRAGEERSGVDFVTQSVATARVEGTLVDSEGRPVPTAQITIVPKVVTLIDPFSMLNSRATVVNGRFVATGLTPGEYTFSARAAGRSTGPGGPSAPPAGRGGAPPGPTLWAMAEVTVAGQNLSGIELKLEPGLVMSGRVAIETSTSQPPGDLSRFRANMRTWMAPGASGVTTSVSSAPPGEDGTFRFSGIVPGRYVVSAYGPGIGVDGTISWVLKSITAGGRDVTDQPLEIRPHEDAPDLVVTFTDKVTELSGTLFDAAGRPTPEFSIIVFPANKAFWTQNSRRIRPIRPASDGRFKTSGLPPGEYFMSAVADYDQADLYDASFLDQLAAAGYKITLAEGEKKTQDLKLAGGIDAPLK